MDIENIVANTVLVKAKNCECRGRSTIPLSSVHSRKMYVY